MPAVQKSSEPTDLIDTVILGWRFEERRIRHLQKEVGGYAMGDRYRDACGAGRSNAVAMSHSMHPHFAGSCTTMHSAAVLPRAGLLDQGSMHRCYRKKE